MRLFFFTKIFLYQRLSVDPQSPLSPLLYYYAENSLLL